MKDFRPGLENGNDPKRKLVMGVVALIAVFAIGIALDFANHSLNHTQAEPAPQEAVVEEEPTPEAEEGDAKEEEPRAETEAEDVEKVGAIEFTSAGNLDAFDVELKASLAEYVDAYLGTKDVKSADVTVDVVSQAVNDQQGASASLYVVGGDLYLTCTYDPTYKSWSVEGQSGSELREQISQKDEDLKAKEDELKQKDEQISQKDQEIESLKTQLTDAQNQVTELQNAYNEVADMYTQLQERYEQGR